MREDSAVFFLLCFCLLACFDPCSSSILEGEVVRDVFSLLMMKHTRETSFLVSDPTLEALPVPGAAFREGSPPALGDSRAGTGVVRGSSGYSRPRASSSEGKPRVGRAHVAVMREAPHCGVFWVTVHGGRWVFSMKSRQVTSGHTRSVAERTIVPPTLRVAEGMVDR